ncbi:hypothetical protein V3481_006328 [Fusarium oxysporum f. sp. vasinfectum]
MSSPITTDVGSPENSTPSDGMLAWLSAILLPIMALTMMFLVGLPNFKESIGGRGQGLRYPLEQHRLPQCHQALHSVGTCRTSTPLLLQKPAKT